MSDQLASNNESEEKIQALLQIHMDSKAENLDFNVTSKLSAARHRALSQPGSAAATARNKWLVPPKLIGSAATLAVAVTVGIQYYPQEATLLVEESQLTQSSFMEDIDILSGNDEIEFYQSMEFLEWMASN